MLKFEANMTILLCSNHGGDVSGSATSDQSHNSRIETLAIVIPTVLGIILLAWIAYCCIRRKKRRRRLGTVEKLKFYLHVVNDYHEEIQILL